MHIDLYQVCEVSPGQGMVVDGECEVIIAGGLSQPHIVERIQSCCRHVPRLKDNIMYF